MKEKTQNLIIDLSGVSDRKSLHQRLDEAFQFPFWYGGNLDALYDALTDISVPMYVCLIGWEELKEAAPDYFGRFCRVLYDAEKELPDSSFIFMKKYGCVFRDVDFQENK